MQWNNLSGPCPFQFQQTIHKQKPFPVFTYQEAIEKFGADKVIAISSVPEYNAQLKEKGVTKVVLKDYQYLDKFAEAVVKIIGEIVSKMPLIEDD